MLTSDVYGHKPKHGDVGIEVEVEFTPPVIPLENIGGIWLAKHDGSLRNGMEYVCRNPIKVTEEKLPRIKHLTDKLNVPEMQVVQNSPRTSIHVHVNVCSLTILETWTAIIAYWMVENALMIYCGKDTRVGNHFCLRLADAEGMLNLCYRDLQGSTPFNTFHPDATKYGGINLSAIPRFGSLEFRGMAGTTDPDRIDKWSTVCYDLVTKAATFGTPERLMDFYLSTEKDAFLFALLPASFIHELKTIAPDYPLLVKKNIKKLAQLAYFHDDWLAWQERVKKNFAPKINKRLDNPIFPGDFPAFTTTSTLTQAQLNNLVQASNLLNPIPMPDFDEVD